MFRGRLLASCLAGGLLGPLALVTLTYALRWLVPGGAPLPLARLIDPFLTPVGWIAAPLLGAAIGAWSAWPAAATSRQRVVLVVTTLVLAAIGVVMLTAPDDLGPLSSRAPQTPRGIARAILRWSYRSPSEVAKILPYSRHPDATVREQAVLALGINLIVTDIERATERWPSRYGDHPLRDSLRTRLMVALGDSSEAVRAEAARGLWKKRRTFGPQPAAAETLAAVLDRARESSSVERMAWLALDAAGGEHHPDLERAVTRFAAATPDSELARAARLVLAR